MPNLLLFLCCLLLVHPGCSGAEKHADDIWTMGRSDRAEDKLLRAINTKRVYESVVIDGEEYMVPVPWRGRKIIMDPLSRDALRQIPVELTKDGSKLFLLHEACDAFMRMAGKAREDNVALIVHSGYRSVHSQRRIFRTLMAQGRTWDDLIRYVAPPGYSEHMLGTVVDLYPSNWQFASTLQYKWLKKNALAFGFTETYPKSGTDGFHWEPWHWKFEGPTH